MPVTRCPFNGIARSILIFETWCHHQWQIRQSNLKKKLCLRHNRSFILLKRQLQPFPFFCSRFACLVGDIPSPVLVDRPLHSLLCFLCLLQSKTNIFLFWFTRWTRL